MLVSGLTNSSSVSISVEPNAPRSMIAFASAFRLGLLPLFDRRGCSVCEASLSVPTRSGFYTSKISLECSHKLESAEIVLGPDWMTACSVILHDDGAELEDPVATVLASLPAGNLWSPNDGMSVVLLS